MADSIVHSTKQLLDEHKDEVSDDEKTAIEAAVTELEEVMKTFFDDFCIIIFVNA
jgi:molecular chaperone DnaK